MATDIASELKSFVSAKGGSFTSLHGPVVTQRTARFFDARMDQVRIYHALQASRVLLEKIDAAAAFDFQEAVLVKERSKQIAYHSQRDHTCHTLNNFVLGWYIYKNSKLLQESFSDTFKKRKLGEGSKVSDDTKFASIWPYVSLLHDVGYIFEGDFSKSSAFKKSLGVRTAITCLQDYFDKKFWRHNRLLMRDKDTLVKTRRFQGLALSGDSMKQLSYSLQKVRNLAPLLREVEKVYSKRVNQTNNAFDLWRENYEFFSNDKMATKIKKLRIDFNKLRTRGLKKGGAKILNHGVCSGLILLQSVTYYYALHTVVQSLKEGGDAIELKRRYKQKQRNYSIDLWWSGLVWATAATAIHDRYQALVTNSPDDDRLSVSDDPLAFLGILVDEIQFWDRFKVFDPTKYQKFFDMPTQSSDVTIKVDNSTKKIVLSAPRHEIDELEASLDQRLEDWREVIFLNAVN